MTGSWFMSIIKQENGTHLSVFGNVFKKYVHYSNKMNQITFFPGLEASKDNL